MGEDYRLHTQALGALPIINHFLERTGIRQVLERLDARQTTRTGPTPSQCLGILLRNLVLDRGPLYALPAWGAPARTELLGIGPEDASHLNDDRVGRALDHLFDADRASMQTETVVRMIHEFDLDLKEFHNDSTTLKLSGAYSDADGTNKRGKPTIKAARGHSKDHRGDLKQLLWNLTVTQDGAVPVHYKAYDGNQNDSPTHHETWEALRRLKGDADFLYVADSKGSGTDFLKHVDTEGGRFVVVLPRTRTEDAWFRDHLQTNQVEWTKVSPKDEEEGIALDAWSACEAPAPSAEGFRVVWLHNALKAEHDGRARHALVTGAVDALHALDRRLQNPRNRLTTRQGVVDAADRIVDGRVRRWVSYQINEEEEMTFRQERRGRPGKNTRYQRIRNVRFRVVACVDEEAVAYDAKSDGMFPLITNAKRDALSLAEAFNAYKYQPRLEKRHQQLKSVYHAAPVFLKSITRIEALLFLYFLAMVVQALLERQIRMGLEEEGLGGLALYPEGRLCAAPTADKALGVFEALQVHQLVGEEGVVQVFWPELTPLQEDILRLAGVPVDPYTQW